MIFDQVAGDALDLFGYERETISLDMVSKFKNLVYYGLRR